MQVDTHGNIMVMFMARISIYEQWEKDGELKDKLILIQGMAREGLTQQQIADNLGINVDTLIEYKKKYTDFSEALKKGKEVVDFQVENALLSSALEGNTTAQIFWLKNRRPDKWRDKQKEDTNAEALERLDNILLEIKKDAVNSTKE